MKLKQVICAKRIEKKNIEKNEKKQIGYGKNLKENNMLDINDMTEEKFLEAWDKDKSEIRQWDDLREYLDEVVGVYKIEMEDIDTYKMRVYGYNVYKIKDRYFKVPYLDYSTDCEWYQDDMQEVQRKAYTKRIEVEEWLSMPD